MVATRKTPIYGGSPEWSAPTANSRIAWALADVIRNAYGANQADARIDLTTLQALDTTWQSEGDEINYRFDKRVTVWEALQTIARAGRAYPVRNNNVISFVRPVASSTPTALFNRHNMVKDSWRVQYRLTEASEHDSIQAIYVDPDNNWRENRVLCQPPGSSAANPKEVRYPGITNRGQAYRMGQYDAETMRKQRKTCRFETELEGLIPQRGDLVTIANEDFNYTQGSELIYESGTTLRVMHDLTWSTASPLPVHAIRLREPNGDVNGPLTVTQGATPNELILASGLTFTPNVGETGQRTLVQFGTLGDTSADWVIGEIRPQGGNKVGITALNYVSSVFTAVTGSPPAAGAAPAIATTDDQPVIDYLLLENTTQPGIIRAAWSPAAGAETYVIEMATSGSPLDWQPVASGLTRTLYEWLAPVGTVYVRVAGVGKVRGVWKQDSTTAATYSETSPTALSATTSLVLASNGEYQTNIVFSFTPPGDDHLVRAYQAEYQLARHNGAWQPLFYGKETSYEFMTAEIGQHQFRVRSVYVPEYESGTSPESIVASDWAETSVTTLGTYTSLASIGLAQPQNPTLFITADQNNIVADIRIRVEYSDNSSPAGALPEFFVLFYAAEERLNQLVLGTDNGSDKLYLDADNTSIAGTFTLAVASGSTTDTIKYTDASGTIDIDLSGLWWISVQSNSSPSNGNTRYYKVLESSATELKLAPGETLPYTPQAGDTIHVVELDWADNRLDEFKLAYIDGEIVKHQGIDYDGNYYLDVVTRAAEGSSQADQTGKTLDYYPALGPGTYVEVIDLADFKDDDGTLTYSGTIDLPRLPGRIVWAAVSCAFFRRGTTSDNAAFARSNIRPLTIGGPA